MEIDVKDIIAIVNQSIDPLKDSVENIAVDVREIKKSCKYCNGNMQKYAVALQNTQELANGKGRGTWLWLQIRQNKIFSIPIISAGIISGLTVLEKIGLLNFGIVSRLLKAIMGKI